MLIKIDSEKLGELIENTLNNYRFDDIFEEEECLNNYNLVDKLCLEEETIDKGKERITSIVDAIISDLLDYQEDKKVIKEIELSFNLKQIRFLLKCLEFNRNESYTKRKKRRSNGLVKIINKQIKNNSNENDFYNYLKSQFTNLEEAKIFYKKWKDNDQIIENHPDWEFSLRAMAAHISNVLEGKEKDDHQYCTDYMSTKYGSEIYFS